MNEQQMFRKIRTEFGKAIRKVYEGGAPVCIARMSAGGSQGMTA